MKCERCGKELSDVDLFCSRCGKAVFEEYMDEDDIWEHYKTDEELEEIKRREALENTISEIEKKEEKTVAAEKKEESVEETVIEEAVTEEAVTEEPALEETSQEEEKAVFEEKESEPTMDEEILDTLEVLNEEKPELKEEPSKEESVDESDMDDDTFWQSLEDDEDEEEGSEEPEREKKISRKKKEAPVKKEKPKKPEEPKEPKQKIKKSSWAIYAAFLLVCLGIGILWGLKEVRDMEAEKKEYYAKMEAEEKEEENQAAKEAAKAAEDKAKAEEAKKAAKEAKKKEEVKEKEQETEKKPEKKPDEKKETFTLVDKNSVDFSKLSKVSIASTDENSRASSSKYDYSAFSTVDGDTTTSWQEGEEGLGEGTGIRLDFEGNRKVKYLVLYLGNWRDEDLWKSNARPSALSIKVGDNLSFDVEVPDEMKPFCIELGETVDASYLSVYIKSGYAGADWNDNCISEVEIYE